MRLEHLKESRADLFGDRSGHFLDICQINDQDSGGNECAQCVVERPSQGSPHVLAMHQILDLGGRMARAEPQHVE